MMQQFEETQQISDRRKRHLTDWARENAIRVIPKPFFVDTTKSQFFRTQRIASIRMLTAKPLKLTKNLRRNLIQMTKKAFVKKLLDIALSLITQL
jgi:hypothetical protein